jgi:hypothetical protein
MPSPVVTPNMSLTAPGVGVTTSPAWALLINADLSTIDQHNHTTGMGVPIPVAGLDIDADLPLNSHSITLLNSAVFAGAVSGTPSVLSLYSNGTDLFFKDVNGNAIRLTQAGGPTSGTGNIQGLPSTPTGDAGILWVNAQSTFQLLKDSGTVGANLDAGTLVIRYPGSYPTPSGNYIALKAPTSLATGLSYTLPGTLPGAADALLLTNASGVQSFLAKGTANTVLRVNSGGTTLEYSTIDTANITNLAVTGAKIADGTISNSKLAVPNSASNTFSGTSTSTSTTVGTLSFTPTGRPVLITISSTLAGGQLSATSNTAEANCYLTLNDGSNISGWRAASVAGSALGVGVTVSVPLSFSFFYTPSAGAKTYTLTLTDDGAGGVHSCAITAGVITAIEF